VQQFSTNLSDIFLKKKLLGLGELWSYWQYCYRIRVWRCGWIQTPLTALPQLMLISSGSSHFLLYVH